MCWFVVLGAAAAEGVGEGLRIVPGLFFSQLVAFLVVAFCLWRFAYGPILGVLDERRRRIEEGMVNAERIKAELASTEAAREEVLEGARVRAARLVEEARAAAALVQEREERRAEAEAEAIVARGREAAAAERTRMLAELRQEVGGLVVRTTAQVVGRVLSDEDQRRLAEEASRELASG